MKRIVAVTTLLLLCGCPGAEPAIEPPADAGPLAACAESPSALPRPPGGGLPCELLPPGFTKK